MTAAGAGVSLAELVAHLGGELIGGELIGGELIGGELIGYAAASIRIDRIGAIEDATPSTITFLANPRLQPLLAASTAGCVIVAPALREAATARGAAIVTPDPYLYYARLTQWWAARSRHEAPAGVHPSAVVDPSARLGAGVSIGPLVVIEADAHIGDSVVIGAHSVVGRAARIGTGTRLAARVTFGERCRIGARGILHSGVVIGADGFGFAPTEGRWEKIEQLGAVRIGDDVEIGANTCIDRGALDDTVIEEGVKLDNLIQIGHNVRIGKHTAMAGCVGVAGSAVIGAHCTLGGGVGIVGHLTLADNVHVTGMSMVTRSIGTAGARYSSGWPAEPSASWWRRVAEFRRMR